MKEREEPLKMVVSFSPSIKLNSALSKRVTVTVATNTSCGNCTPVLNNNSYNDMYSI